MTSDFDSILAKARKLAALADPANGGSEGERENAQRMLEAHLQRHDIALEGLQAERIARRELIVRTNRKTDKPGLHAKLRVLAINLFWYVVGDSKRPVFYRKAKWGSAWTMAAPGGRVKNPRPCKPRSPRMKTVKSGRRARGYE